MAANMQDVAQHMRDIKIKLDQVRLLSSDWITWSQAHVWVQIRPGVVRHDLLACCH